MAEFTLRDVMQVLEEGWGEYVKRYNALSSEAQAAFLQKEGFDTFHDLLAHIIGWWEEALRIINGILREPGFAWREPPVDAFNLELTKKYSAWSDADLLSHYEKTRMSMLELVTKLPDDALLNPDIEGWLASDVVHHYEDHII